MITKDKLFDLYVNKKLTPYEIAEVYNVDPDVVKMWFDNYNMKANFKRKYNIIKKTPLTKEQKELVIGVLLGHGKIVKHGKEGYRLTVVHPEKERALIMWKKSILGNFVNVVRETEKKKSNIWTFNTATHNDFRFFRKLFYDGNKKVIRNEIINYITDLSLASWIMDCGINLKEHMRISIRFSKKESEILQNALKVNFGLRCKICEYSKNEKKYYYISLNKRNFTLLSDLIKPHVIDDMAYKLINHPQRLNAKHPNGDDIV